MHSFKSINQFGGLLVFTLFASVAVGCDAESERGEELIIDFDASATTEEIAEFDHADEPRGSTNPPRVEHIDEDECGFADRHYPANIGWFPGEVPKVAVELDATIGPDDRVTLQFHGGRMGEPRIQPMGDPVTVRASGSFALPDDILAATRTGKQYVVMALLDVCEADEPQQNCLRRNTDVMNVEEGKFFAPAEYQVFLREKYSAKYPWLFEHGGTVTHIIEGEGN